MALQLNLGCGDRYVKGWWNVDWKQCPHDVDEYVDLTGPLPWRERSVSHIYAGHLLEHLTPSQAQTLLARLRTTMVKDGVIMVVGPDMNMVRAMIKDGTFDATVHSLESLRDGDDRWPGTRHQWETTRHDIQAMLETAGWIQVHQHTTGGLTDFWPVADRAPAWQYAVGARRGG